MADKGQPDLGLRERKKRRTRALLIDAAIGLFCRQGFEGTTVDQIAAVADVSPRTFSRYFAAKDEVVLTLIDQGTELAARGLARQPAELPHLEAVRRAFVEMYREANGTAAGDRLIAVVRTVMCSPTLRQAVRQFRPNPLHRALAERMGVPLEDPGLRLIAAIWNTIVLTAQDDLGPDTDWDALTAADLADRIDAMFARFVDETAGIGQPA